MNMAPTILVLDDNIEVAELFRICFNLCGFNVILARTLQEACDLCSQQRIDAMVVDFKLPDGRGPDILKRLAEKCPKLRLLVTGYGGDLRTQYPGFDGYYTKPVDCHELCEFMCSRLKGQEYESGKVQNIL